MKSKKSSKARHCAEGGPATNAEYQRTIPRQMAQGGGMMATMNRKMQGMPDQKRKIDDSPSTMRRNRDAAKRKR